MVRINRILCPVDFSETSKRAFEYALALAGQLGAELEVIHVLQLPAYTLPEGGFELTPDFETDLSNRLRRQLDEFTKQPAQPSVKVTSALYEGIPYVEITRAAKKHGADLIVIGTHGRTGFSHLLMGSVAERVVRTSEVPVLSIHG
jgi:nucleotide-binding universal stress UspA family protein